MIPAIFFKFAIKMVIYGHHINQLIRFFRLFVYYAKSFISTQNDSSCRDHSFRPLHQFDLILEYESGYNCKHSGYYGNNFINVYVQKNTHICYIFSMISVIFMTFLLIISGQNDIRRHVSASEIYYSSFMSSNMPNLN